MAWSSELIKLFEELKVTLTSSFVLAQFDEEKSTFLKIDWSAEDIDWIIMQPAKDVESSRATKELLDTGNCLFDLSKDGPRLQPIQFESRSCTNFECKYHSLVGETAAGR